jgi:hypothetical protein
MDDPTAKALGITVSLTSRGIDDFYDLDKLGIADILFKPFQPMELVADLWNRIHLVKFGGKSGCHFRLAKQFLVASKHTQYF